MDINLANRTYINQDWLSMNNTGCILYINEDKKNKGGVAPRHSSIIISWSWPCSKQRCVEGHACINIFYWYVGKCTLQCYPYTTQMLHCIACNQTHNAFHYNTIPYNPVLHSQNVPGHNALETKMCLALE